MEKVQYDNKPPKLETVGNGSWLYRWGIKKVKKTEEDGSYHYHYECFEVVCWKNNRKEITRAVIRATWNADEEAKLVNDFNGATSGLLDKSFKQPYLDFINERDALKQDVKTFFEG